MITDWLYKLTMSDSLYTYVLLEHIAVLLEHIASTTGLTLKQFGSTRLKLKKYE